MLMFISGPIGWLIGAVTAIIANWDTLKEYFEYFWDNPEAALFRFQNWVQESIKNAVEAGRKKWDELKAWLDKPIFATFIAPAWDSFKKSAMAAFENVKARAGAAFDGVKASITGAVNSAVETVKNLPETIAGAAGYAAGYLFEMLGKSPLIGLIVVGRNREDTADAVEISVGDSIANGQGIVTTKSQHDGYAAADGLDDEVLQGATLGFGHSGSLAGGSKSDNIVNPITDEIVDEGFEFAEIDGLLFPKRRYQSNTCTNKWIFHELIYLLLLFSNLCEVIEYLSEVFCQGEGAFATNNEVVGINKEFVGG